MGNGYPTIGPAIPGKVVKTMKSPHRLSWINPQMKRLVIFPLKKAKLCRFGSRGGVVRPMIPAIKLYMYTPIMMMN